MSRSHRGTNMDSVDLECAAPAPRPGRSGPARRARHRHRTWGSAPRPVGAMVAIRDDGQVVGSVSGGCVEDDLIDEGAVARPSRATDARARHATASPTRKRRAAACRAAARCSWCSSRSTDEAASPSCCDASSASSSCARTLDMETGRATLEPGAGQDVLRVRRQRARRRVHGPRWRLLLIGAGQLTRYLAADGAAARLPRRPCATRARNTADGWDLAGVPLNRGMPDDVVRELKPRRATARVVALTHDPKLDDLALMEALKSAAFYVGAHRLEEEQRRAPRAPGGVRRLAPTRSRACAARSACTSARRRRPRSRSRSSPR